MLSKFVPLNVPLYGKVTREVFNPDFIRLQVFMRGQEIFRQDEPEWLEFEIRIECIARFRPCPEC